MSGTRTMHWNLSTDMVLRFTPRRVIPDCTRLLEVSHICLVRSPSITAVCFSNIFFRTQVRQSKCLNSEKLNVPKQPEEDTLLASRYVWPEFHYGCPCSLFYCFESNAKCLLFLRRVEIPGTYSPWQYKSSTKVNRNEIESLFHVWWIIKNLKLL